jgi:hypothetical protein
MGIKENFDTNQREIKINPHGDFANEVKQKALDAIYQGVYSEAWVNFMRLFANSEVELARLIGSDGTRQYQKARAMLVASAAVGLENIGDISELIEELEDEL